jgi:superfamily II DNA helicase RecQ
MAKNYFVCEQCVKITFGDALDSSEINFIILNCFNELKVSSGRTLLSELLKGKINNYIFEEKLNENNYFGSLKNLTKSQIINLIDQVIEQGYLEVYSSDKKFNRPLIKITESGKKILEKVDK